MKTTITTFACAAISATAVHAMPADIIDSALLKPTGQYSVGYKDYHWIDTSRCPDINYNGDNDADYSPENANHCREIVARTYYPIAATQAEGDAYYKPFVESQLALLQHVPGVTKNEALQLTKVKTFTFQNKSIVPNQQFPVLLFAPGFTFPGQTYENNITQLVSHGYIVVAVNSPFINLTALPNGHVVMPVNTRDEGVIEKTYVPMEAADIAFVYGKLRQEHSVDNVFTAMDLNHIGGFGHSVGARIIADTAHAHPAWFTAAATLDIGFDTTGESQKKFAMPFMHEIGADRSTAAPSEPIHFELGRDGYAVTISPSKSDTRYSRHMNFSDFSTIQYLPAYVKALEFAKQLGMALVGDGNGHEIAEHTSDYLTAFFDVYLKGKSNTKLHACKTLTTDSIIQCGS